MATQMTWPPSFLGSVVGFGKDRVVVVARVLGVDGDERQLAQVLAALEACGLHAVGLGQHLLGEIVRDAVLVDRDERDGLGFGRIADAGRDPRAGQAEAAFGAGLLGLHELAFLRAAGRHPAATVHSLGRALVDRQDATAFGVLAEDARPPCGGSRRCGG